MIKTLLLAAWLIPDQAARSLANLVSPRSLHFFSQSKLSPAVVVMETKQSSFKMSFFRNVRDTGYFAENMEGG